LFVFAQPLSGAARAARSARLVFPYQATSPSYCAALSRHRILLYCNSVHSTRDEARNFTAGHVTASVLEAPSTTSTALHSQHNTTFGHQYTYHNKYGTACPPSVAPSPAVISKTIRRYAHFSFGRLLLGGRHRTSNPTTHPVQTSTHTPTDRAAGPSSRCSYRIIVLLSRPPALRARLTSFISNDAVYRRLHGVSIYHSDLGLIFSTHTTTTSLTI
jgi:hypothetical protein